VSGEREAAARRGEPRASIRPASADRPFRNIGPTSREWLRAVGIETFEELERLGSAEAWRRAMERFPERVSVVLLYALEGALLGLPWNELPPEVVRRLDAVVGRPLTNGTTSMRKEGTLTGPALADDGRTRCGWVGRDPLDIAYHDEEWGVPEKDDLALFERLLLEGFQAGLSWSTILKKREGFRRAFDGFDPKRIAAYGDADIARLLADPGIVRNRLKVAAAVTNARAFLAAMDEPGGFSGLVWSFAPPPRAVRPATLAEIPATTPESDGMSKELKRRGFKFVGSTICYAFMQSAGLVDDHVAGCFRAVEQHHD